MSDIRAALEEARTGLLWYRDRYPEAVDGSDDEAMARIDAALAAAPRADATEAPSDEPAPAHSLPDWAECDLRVANSDFLAKRVAAGGYGPEADSKLAKELHRFIHEYDDADSYRSAWFMHRLEKLLDETRRDALATPKPAGAPSDAAPQVPAELVAFILGNRYRTQEGKWVKFVGVANEGTDYETMYDEEGIHRYTRRDFGRVTGSAHDYSEPRNTPPLYATPPAPSVQAGMPCEDCNGHGEVGDEIPQGEFQPPERERCESCNGSGWWPAPSVQASQAVPSDADMFWDEANPERMAYSIHDVVIERISDCGSAVGDEVTIQRAKRLPNVTVRILDAESGDYEYIDAPLAAPPAAQPVAQTGSAS